MSDDVVVLAKLEMLCDRVDEMNNNVKEFMSKVQSTEVWKEKIEGRLSNGAETMTKLQADKDALRTQIEQMRADFDKKLEGYIEKKVIRAYVLGTAVGTGGLAAGLMQLFGH